MSLKVPVVLTMSGLDPSGGAGCVADIQTLAALGVHSAPIITALTVQDSVDVQSVVAVKPELILEQGRAVLSDFQVNAIKIGMLGSVAALSAAETLIRLAGSAVPVIVDPVLASGSGSSLAAPGLVVALQERLLPMTLVVTPNVMELAQLAGFADGGLVDQVERVLSFGVSFVLVTGTHSEPGGPVVNRLFDADGLVDESEWPRLPGEYHGSGCTLAAAVGGYLARGLSVAEAVRSAQCFTWNALKTGARLGAGQQIPFRLNPGAD
ncbi:MAG: hydroxymethylpyrimidine/phosphomethylpyrimidine kinase [Gammaproteobacteria bacterium]|nr:hydroxymethylpyrimidine/phosphomethylpyrimidine kinase [Gammaproteobacteria bacterium]